MDELRIVLNADEQLRVDMQDETPLTLNLQNAEVRTVTDNYEDLTNKPSVNGVTLEGNRSGADLGLVNKSGDTMTGNLQMTAGAKLSTLSADIDIASTPSSSKNQDVAVGTDKNGNIINFMRSVQDSSGNTGVEFNARRSVGGTTYFNGVTFKISPTGERSVGVTDDSIWRKALGLDGVLAYKDQTVSVSMSANTWTDMTVTQQVAPTGYTALTRTIADGSTTAIRGYLYLIPNNMGNTAHILLYATQDVSGTFTLRTWFIKTSVITAL